MNATFILDLGTSLCAANEKVSLEQYCIGVQIGKMVRLQIKSLGWEDNLKVGYASEIKHPFSNERIDAR